MNERRAMSPQYHTKFRWNSVITVSILCALLEALGSGVDAACTKYCNAGDTLSGSTCTSTVPASDNCPSGFSPSGGQCVDAGARCSGIISTMYANIGDCCYGTKKAPATSPSGSSCFSADGGPGGFYCRTSTVIGCYSNTRAPSSCPSGSTADGNDCVRSLTYSCPSGYTRSGTTCTDTYAASTITTSTQCNTASPATDGCQWCSAISACLTDAPQCPASCLVMPQTTCSNSEIPSTCQWCSAIGVCQKDAIGCFASCLNATADSSICDASASCEYCTAIGVCQRNNGTCWTACTPASDDPLGTDVCTVSANCKWCPTLNYCTERTRDCHTQCTTVAPDEPAICQVQSIQAQCQWCGAPGSVEYCVARTDEARLRCAVSCGGLIWRQDVCDGALECHWCGVHNAAQGGRCKPLPGKSRGYVAWRREVECDTGSRTSSSSSSTTRSMFISISVSRYESVSTSASRSNSRSLSLTASLRFTQSASDSLTQRLSKSMSSSASDSFSGWKSTSTSWSKSKSQSTSSSLDSLSLMLTNSTSSTMTLMVTKRSNSFSLSDTTSLLDSKTMTSSPTDTHQLTATRYYSRDRTLVEAVAAYMAVGLSMTSVLSGSTVATSLGCVIAARNVGQCWGPAGSSVFSLPVDVCGGPSNKDETQLEAQGDLVVSVGLLSFGIVGLVSCAALYVAVKGYTWRAALEKLSILSILTPLWGAVLPILVGGAITAAVAPMSEEHPLAFLCEGSSGLIAVSFVLTVLLFIALSVVPLAAPALFRVACQRRSFTSQAIGSSLIARLMGWLRRSGRHEWFWKSTNAASAPSAHRIVRTLLLEYRALWYAALDFTDVCVVAILGAIGPLLPWSACVGTASAVVAVFALQLVACAVGRPMARPIDWYVNCTTLSLTTVCSILRLIYGTSKTDDEREDRSALLVVAAGLDIAVSVVTFAPIVLDIIDLLRHGLCNKRLGSTKYDDENGNEDLMNRSADMLPTKNLTDDDLAMNLLSDPLTHLMIRDDALTNTNDWVGGLRSSRSSDVNDEVPTHEPLTRQLFVETQSEGDEMLSTDLLAAYYRDASHKYF